MAIEARLTLNPDDYNAALEAAKKNTENLRKEIEKTGKNISDTAKSVSQSIEQSAKRIESSTAKTVAKTASSWNKALEKMSKGGVEKAIGEFAGGGWSGGIIAEGLKSAQTIVKEIYRLWKQKKEDTIEFAARTTDSMKSVHDESEKVRQTNEKAFDSLRDLAGAEELSNVQKNQAIKLIQQLEESYGKLGISIDTVTGKLKGADSSIVSGLKANKGKRIKELEALIKNQEQDAANQQNLMDDAGFGLDNLADLTEKTSFLGKYDPRAAVSRFFNKYTNYRLGGDQDAFKAQEKRDKILTEMAANRKELARIKKSTPEQDYIDELKANLMDRENANRKRVSALGTSRAQAKYDASSTEDKIAAKRAELERIRSTQAALLAQGNSISERADNEADETKRLELKRQYLDLEKKYIDEQEKEFKVTQEIAALEKTRAGKFDKLLTKSATIREKLGGSAELDAFEKRLKDLKANVKISVDDKQFAAFEKQLTDLEARSKFIRNETDEYKYQELKLAGKDREAEKLKLQSDLKKNNAWMSDADAAHVAEQRLKITDAQKSKDWRTDNRDKLRDLQLKQLEKTDKTEAEFQRAKLDAKKKLGRDLTGGESDLLRRMTTLSSGLSEGAPKAANLKIETNELTARGGFQGGALVPPKENYNKDIRTYNEKQTRLLEDLKTLIQKFTEE